MKTPDYLVLPFVAFRINWAISWGWDTYDAWLALIDTVVAFICFAKRRCASGGMIWSLSDTWYRVDCCFQAGGPDFSVKIDWSKWLLHNCHDVSFSRIHILSKGSRGTCLDLCKQTLRYLKSKSLWGTL